MLTLIIAFSCKCCLPTCISVHNSPLLCSASGGILGPKRGQSNIKKCNREVHLPYLMICYHAGAHTDWGFFTFVETNNTPGEYGTVLPVSRTKRRQHTNQVMRHFSCLLLSLLARVQANQCSPCSEMMILAA